LNFYPFINAGKENAAAWRGREQGVETYFEIEVPVFGGKKTAQKLFLYRRKAGAEIICRLEMLYVTAGESWYLRLIIKNTPIMSYDDALTFEGHVYATFQQAAIARGLVLDVEDALQCFMEAANSNNCVNDMHLTSANLRALFCHLTLSGYPTINIYEREDLRECMLTDFRNNHQGKTTSQVRPIYGVHFYLVSFDM
jgi:hypothetical protein